MAWAQSDTSLVSVTQTTGPRRWRRRLTTGEERFNLAAAPARGQDRRGYLAHRTALRGMPYLVDRPCCPGPPEGAPNTGVGTIAQNPLTCSMSVRPVARPETACSPNSMNRRFCSITWGGRDD